MYGCEAEVAPGRPCVSMCVAPMRRSVAVVSLLINPNFLLANTPPFCKRYCYRHGTKRSSAVECRHLIAVTSLSQGRPWKTSMEWLERAREWEHRSSWIFTTWKAACVISSCGAAENCLWARRSRGMCVEVGVSHRRLARRATRESEWNCAAHSLANPFQYSAREKITSSFEITKLNSWSSVRVATLPLHQHDSATSTKTEAFLEWKAFSRSNLLLLKSTCKALQLFRDPLLQMLMEFQTG